MSVGYDVNPKFSPDGKAIAFEVKAGDRVILKVNAAFATPPILSATTHPDLVGEVVRLCIAAGASCQSGSHRWWRLPGEWRD